jgi:deoxyribodipyrimidine photolyase
MPKASELTVEQFEELKEQVTRHREEASKAEGVLEQLKNQLREEFGISVAAGPKELIKRKKELEKSRTAVQKKLEAYREKWGME